MDSVPQREYLRAKGCDQVLGLCTSPPLPSQEVLKLLRQRTTPAANVKTMKD